MQMRQYASEDVIVAFSGGVDSSLLLKLACDFAEETGASVYGVFFHTMLHPTSEVKSARKVAEEMKAIFRVLKINELEAAGISDNPKDRCYRCKKYLFETLKKEAGHLGVERILEGTNEDDLHVYRPGMQAVKELGIISPLAEAGLTKKEVRRLADEYGISVAQKPSAPCLATRFPYGVRLSYEAMNKVHQGEEYLRKMGLYNVRLRSHGEIARIEVDVDAMEKIMEERDNISEYMKELGYVYVTLDLEGFRSGSMDKENAAGGI